MSRSVTVIGGGASGLAAAIAAAEHGAQVTVLERLPRVGKKLLLTGSGRCNLGHAGFDFSHYHGTLPQAERILAQFDAQAYFRRLGLYTRTDAEGRIYPMSNTAASVLDALRFAAEQRGVQTLCGQRVTGLSPRGDRWQIFCGDVRFSADAVILAAGGSAAPNCGTDGNLLPLLKKMGFPITPPHPALCPVPTDAARVKALKGMRVRAAASAIAAGRVLKTESGEVQFTEQALSGICIFNLSRFAAEHGASMEISLDLLHDFAPEDTAGLLRELMERRGNLPAGDLLTGLLPKRIAETLIRQSGGAGHLPARTLSAEAQSALCTLLRDWRFPVKGTAAFAQAQVTAGGIAGHCVTDTLESKRDRGLFFCGELLDLDGDCGGYNLTWCWASGETAGRAAAWAADDNKEI